MMNCGWDDKYRCGYQIKKKFINAVRNKEIRYLKHNTKDDKNSTKRKKKPKKQKRREKTGS